MWQESGNPDHEHYGNPTNDQKESRSVYSLDETSFCQGLPSSLLEFVFMHCKLSIIDLLSHVEHFAISYIMVAPFKKSGGRADKRKFCPNFDPKNKCIFD